MPPKFAPKKSLSSLTSPQGKPTGLSKPSGVKTIPSKPGVVSKASSPLSKGISHPSRPTPPKANLAPLKTGVERPVLRAFECLVNVELAQKAFAGVGIYVGPDAAKQRALVEQITQDLIQLQLSYKTYWKEVAIESKDKADFKGN